MNSKFCRFVVVDAYPLFRLGLTELLNKVFHPASIEEASDSASFQNLVMSKSARLDLVLLDVNLPGADVVAMVDLARSFIPNLKIIALADRYNEAIAARLLAKHINAIILKSSDVKQVEVVLRSVMQKGFCFSAGIPDIDYRMVVKQKSRKGRRYSELTDREIQIIKLIAEEKTTDEIGAILSISPRTVEGYRKKILIKTSSKNTAGIVMFGVQNHIVTVSSVVAYR
ncbi:response regulator transcription factor [Alistipes sp. ZOR0009]|uniref:response regulator transcription factor n=1 Tax=Alistipes sp. ZOR0009 TaxID=1339253 RepID=UPI0009DF0998|nr:response regulator transcription factor [Alistipes sp. ZOR0009]